LLSSSANRLKVLVQSTMVAACCSCSIGHPYENQRGRSAHAVLGGAAGSAADSTASATTADGVAASGSPDAAGVVVLPNGGLRRLTNLQYANSVTDLLGAGSNYTGQLDPDVPLLFLTNVGAATVTLTPQGVALYHQAATALAAQVFATPASAQTFVGCSADLAKGAQDPCVSDFVKRVGQRAWRRPLSDVEQGSLVAVYAAVVADSGDSWQGFSAVTEAMLASPYFIYRAELGTLQADGTSRLDGYEIASRLSYLLWNSMPDTTLIADAAQNKLGSPAGIQDSARRLLDDPRAKNAIKKFMREWLGFDGLSTLSKDAKAFPQFSATLGASFQGELDYLVDDLVFARPGDFTTLLNRTSTFANGELAKFYGLTTPSSIDPKSFAAVALPNTGVRSGLLSMGGFLATQAKPDATAPVSRGHYVMSRLLCAEVPAPPPNVPALPPESSSALRTQRQRLDAHTASAGCAGCHQAMDGLGLVLEHFDGSGAFRDTDRGMRLDVTGSIDGQNVDGARQLGAALQASAKVQACMVRQLYRQALGVQDGPGQGQHIEALRVQFANAGFNYQQLILSMVAADDFSIVGGKR